MIENRNIWSLSVVATFPGYAPRGFCVMKDFDSTPRFVDPVTFQERDYRIIESNRADFSAFKNIPSFRTFLAALGYTVGAWRYVNISSLVFRFSATTTNGHVLDIGGSESMAPVLESTNQNEALTALHSDHDFNDLFTQIAGWL